MEIFDRSLRHFRSVVLHGLGQVISRFVPDVENSEWRDGLSELARVVKVVLDENFPSHI